MNTLFAIILSTIAGFGTLLGSILIFIPKFNKNSYISLFLAFSGTIMLLISTFDLMPHSIININNNYNIIPSIILITVPFGLGILIINTLDKKITKENNLYKIGILSLISLTLHNFPEGIATFISSVYNIELGIQLTLAILMHNIPEGICISIPIYQATKSYKKALLYSFYASLSEPLGAILAFVLLKNYINEITISIILIFVSGLMITLSINNIYKESLNNKKYFIYGTIMGIILMLLNLLI